MDVSATEAAADAVWAKFDAGWYLRTYPKVRGMLFDLAESSVLAYYRDQGQQQRHSPNPFFDEGFFLHCDRTAAHAVRDGAAASGFALYCSDRGRHRKPHWLFDEAFYRRMYPDLTDARLADNGLVNGYDHFLRHGARERRVGNPFFDPVVFRDNLAPDEAARAELMGCFIAYITSLHGRDAIERPTSHYFDPKWYLQTYPSVGPLIARRRALSALHHYLTNETPAEFDPLTEFSETFYLKLHPDVAAAVKAGKFHNGYEHFVYHGVFELRSPHASIDLKYYVEAHRSVREDLKLGLARDAFAHYLSIGRAQGLHTAPPPDETVTEGQAQTLLLMRGQALPPLLARRPLDFSYDGEPALSAIVTVRDGFVQTLQTLASLRANFIGAIELIVVGLGSTDGTMRIERCVSGATVLRFDVDIGVLKGRNAGLQGASADRVLFLGGGIEMAPGAIHAGLDRLAADPTIGAVGGKLLLAHGRVQEAGGIVSRDGTVRSYLRDAPATSPEANFVRDVDFCSAGFLIARADLLHSLEGFSTDYAPGTCEDADLGLRIATAGYRVVYDPAIVVHRLAVGATAADADIAQARETFRRHHAAVLDSRFPAGPVLDVSARVARASATGVPERRILFIAETVPLRMSGGVAVRSSDLIAAMVSLGCHVTVFPILPHHGGLAATHGDLPDTVEVMHDRTIDDLSALLNRRAGYFDVVWVAGVATLDRVRPVIAPWMKAVDKAPRVILDVVSIAALQNAGQAALSAGEPAVDPDPDEALKAEFASAALCQYVVAVSAHEAGWLRGIGLDAVAVIGPARDPAPTPRCFEERTGLLFVGAIDAANSPNHDGLCWFVDAVLPLVEKALGWETRLTIAGTCDNPALLDRFRKHPRVTLRGALADLTQTYDAHRIFVAPMRFGAGLPYKVYEAASHGLPVVASDVVSGQMAWRQGGELLSAPVTDAARFAEQIVGLYRDEALWQHLRDAAMARIAAENSSELAVASLRALLE
jgi:glycosyltransferase involved in cell wall biosynthesis/GT2 family glycosyltransferase